MARLGEGIPRGLAWSADGSMLALASSRGVTVLSDPSVETLWRAEQSGGQTTLAFSPDGNILAAGGMDGRITLFHTTDGTAIDILNAHSFSVSSLTFSQDGRKLASSGLDRSIKIWEIRGRNLIGQFPSPGRGAQALAFSKDGRILFAWSPDEQVNIWSLEKDNRLEDLYIGSDGHGHSATQAAFSGDGRLLASAQGRKVRLTRTENGTTLSLLQPLPEDALQVALSHDGSQVVVLMRTRVQIWETEKPVLAAEMPRDDPARATTPLSITPNGSRTALAEQELTIWDPSAGSGAFLHHPLRFSPGSITRVQFGLDEKRAILAMLGGNLFQLDLHSGEAAVRPAPLPAGDAMALLPDGSLVAAAYPNRRLQVWDNEHEGWLFKPTSLPARASHLAFSPDGNLLAGSVGEGGVRLWSLADGTLVASLETDHPTLQLEFSPDGKWLAAGTLGSVVYWSTADWSFGGKHPGTSFAFSPKQDQLAVYEWQQGKPVTSLWHLQEDHPLWLSNGGGSRMAFSPDGSLLAGSGHELSLLSTNTGEMTASWNNPSPQSIPAFTPDGEMLLLAGWDGTLYVYGVPPE